MGFLILIFLIQFFNFNRKKLLHHISTLFLFVVLVLSTPFVSSNLMELISYNTVINSGDLKKADAIVILGAGISESAREYDGVDLSPSTLQRIRYGAYLFNQTGLPILVSGGKLPGQQYSEAAIMKKILEETFMTPARWIEESSLSTDENAEYSQEILATDKINSIILVTHSWHMNRAARLFEKTGLNVFKAPTDLQNASGELSLMQFLPSAKAFLNSAIALKELYGQLWYSF